MELTIKTFLLRGLAAGAAGGAAAALFIRFLTETQIGWAIGFEEASGLGLPPGEAAEFARSTQHWGGMLAAVIYGSLLGVILGVVLAAFHDRVKGHDEFGRTAKVAGAAFFATALLPGLKYPPNPPTVGDPDTIGQRTWGYLALILVSGLIVIASVWLWNRLTERGITGGARFLAGGAFLTVLSTVAFLAFPSNPDRIEPPNNEATPALEVAADAPPVVLDAMLANARATGDESLRNPEDTEEPLDLAKVETGADLVGTPVQVSTTKLESHAYATMVWTFRIRSFAGLALMWAVMAGVLGLLLDQVAKQTTPATP